MWRYISSMQKAAVDSPPAIRPKAVGSPQHPKQNCTTIEPTQPTPRQAVWIHPSNLYSKTALYRNTAFQKLVLVERIFIFEQPGFDNHNST